jgi:hypothetical protein
MSSSPLTAELEAALVRELAGTYAWENAMRFGKKLVPAVIGLSDSATKFGTWSPTTRTIALSRPLVLERPWHEVVSVLEHEMAHQFVDEVLRVHDETPHGEAFQRVCGERGIDANAGGVPVPSTAGVELDKVLDRIRKLLALAGSPNQHEAEQAMRKAHELMLRHNIDTLARPSDFEVRTLGDPLARTTRVQEDVIALLAEFFFVRVIRVSVYLPSVATSGSVYEICGTRANVEMASHVYAFLLATAGRLWAANRGDARVRNGRDRLAYQSGVIGGFREKLVAERVELKGNGLVWRGDARLDEFYHARHPRIVTRRRTVRINRAHVAGREAGRTVVLHKPVDTGGSGGPRRRLTSG